MSLQFHYTLILSNNPVFSLGGRFVRPRPVIAVAVIGPTGTSAFDALLDTGADDTLFSEDIATAVGVDLTGAPMGSGTGIGMAGAIVRYAEVGLRIATNQEHREWRARVGFTAAKLPYPVLGFAGFLQFFDATFRGGLEEVELTVGALYPGT